MVPTPGLWASCRYPPVLVHTHAHDYAAVVVVVAGAVAVGYASSNVHRCRYSAEAQTLLLHEVWALTRRDSQAAADFWRGIPAQVRRSQVRSAWRAELVSYLLYLGSMSWTPMIFHRSTTRTIDCC